MPHVLLRLTRTLFYAQALSEYHAPYVELYDAICIRTFGVFMA